MKIKVGYNVEIGERGYFYEGKVGRVVAVYEEDDYASVEFLNCDEGHNCGGKAKPQSGWNFTLANLEPTNKPLTDCKKFV